jgi:signal peptidase II
VGSPSDRVRPTRDGTSGPGGGAGAASPRSYARLAFAVALVAWALDQVTKAVAVARLTGRSPVQLAGDFLQLTLVRNPGAAFSAGESLTPLISVVAVIAALVIVRYALRVRHRGWAVAIGLLLAGVVGNLTDRLARAPGPLRGHVVDFLQLPHWPVFNVADICINLAAACFVVLLVRGVHLDGTSSRDRSGGKGPHGGR